MQHLVSLPIIAYFRFLFGTLSYFSIYLRSTLKDTKVFCICISTYSHVNQLCDQKELVKNLKKRMREGKWPIISSLNPRNCYSYLYFYFLEMLKQNDSYQLEFVCPLLDMTHTFPMFLCLDFKDNATRFTVLCSYLNIKLLRKSCYIYAIYFCLFLLHYFSRSNSLKSHSSFYLLSWETDKCGYPFCRNQEVGWCEKCICQP